MQTINKQIQASFKEVAPDQYKLTQIIDGHKISYILEKSEARELIGLIDNKIV